MKKTFLMSLLLLSTVVMAQQPVISFSTTEHDFGQIYEGDGRVSTIFEFKNEGMEPLVLTNVKASCGCTTPTWTKTPIEPGETGSITVTYNPNGRPGTFKKTITITSNASNPTTQVFIRGEVIPKQAKPIDRYSVKMGELSLKVNHLEFGTIYKGNNVTRSLEYANQTDHNITVDILVNDKDNFLISNLSFTELKPGEVGTLNINWDADKCKEWGVVNRKIYFMVNGKRELTDEFRLALTADIEEDFSKWTAVQKQESPIAEMLSEVNLGTVKAGSVASQKVEIKNVGTNALEIRKIQNNNPDLVRAVAKKNLVKAGKSGELNISVNTANQEPGVYHRQVDVLTNDYKSPKRTLRIVWTVE